MTFTDGAHVQWRHRSGTRAGFVQRICRTAEELPEEAFGAKHLRRRVSSSTPAYVIRQEKDNATIVKPESMLSAVQGDGSGESQEATAAKDRKIKQAKTREKKNVEGRSVSQSMDALRCSSGAHSLPRALTLTQCRRCCVAVRCSQRDGGQLEGEEAHDGRSQRAQRGCTEAQSGRTVGLVRWRRRQQEKAQDGRSRSIVQRQMTSHTNADPSCSVALFGAERSGDPLCSFVSQLLT